MSLYLSFFFLFSYSKWYWKSLKIQIIIIPYFPNFQVTEFSYDFLSATIQVQKEPFTYNGKVNKK